MGRWLRLVRTVRDPERTVLTQRMGIDCVFPFFDCCLCAVALPLMGYDTVQALGNMLLAAVLVAGKTVQRLFLGSLRFREVERLHLRIREAVIETCLAMTVFRDDFNTHFILMFGLLLFLKVFHWLAKDRIEFVRFLSLGRRPCSVGLFLLHWGGALGGGTPVQHGLECCAVGLGTSGGRGHRWALT